MYERHQHEQYFFNQATITHLADFGQEFTHPCCLCTPMVGRELVRRRVKVTILDNDERFADLPSFQKYDLYRSVWLGQNFDLILCDPPFFNVSLAQLFQAIRLLSRYDTNQPLLICYLKRREANLLGTFAAFNLQPTGYNPGYLTVQMVERNEIEFYSNLPPEKIETLIKFEFRVQSES
ncbi:MAG: hypothetical protein V9G20_02505 [Candidatus Promineifilaceae bacterium]